MSTNEQALPTLMTEQELLDIVDSLIRDRAFNRPAAVAIGMAVGAAVEAEVRAALTAEQPQSDVQRDAERYRWLREKNGQFYRTKSGADALRVALSHFDGTTDMWVHCMEGLDAAVDAAIARERT